VAIQIYLTSSKRVMGKYVNSPFLIFVLSGIAAIVTFLNIKLLFEFIKG
jgi:manganese transport protein